MSSKGLKSVPMKVEEGTIEAIYNNQKQNPLHANPVLQIISYQKIGSTSGEKFRYRANLSDGTYYMRAVFSSDVTSLFDKELITKYSLIRFEKFNVRTLKENNYLYIQEIKEYENCNIEIGKAVNYETGKASLHDSSKTANNNMHGDRNKPTSQKNTAHEESEAKKMKVDSTKIERSEHKEYKQDEHKHNEQETEVISINALNPYNNKWTIRGRIVLKSDIKKYSTKRGDGKLFSFEIADDTSQIKVVAFNELVDVFYPIIEVGSVYTIMRGQVKMANKQYTANKNEYEIQLDKNSEVNVVNDTSAPKYFFDFTKISDVNTYMTTADVIGVAKEVYPMSTFIVKSTQKESCRRDLILVDETGNIKCTLWGNKAEEEIDIGSVIAIKNVKVSDYNGVSLSSLNSTQIYKNPDITESHALLGWYNDVGVKLKIDIPDRDVKTVCISEIKNQEMPFSSCKATIMFIKEDSVMYEACKEDGCTKKVYKNDFGEYRCEKCDKSFYECNYRFMVNINISDYTGQIWATLFNDQACALFGVSCEEFRRIAEEDGHMSMMLIKKSLYKDYVIKLRARQDTYNDEVKTRYNINDIKLVNYINETKKNLAEIEKSMN